jgi:4-carboxymuconolactone decarboxylase
MTSTHRLRPRHLVATALLLAIAQVGHAQTTDPGAARVQRGLEVLSGLTGGKPQPTFEAMRRDFPFLAEATAGYALGDVWGRPGLDPRTRQLAALAAFGALGLRPFFKIHAGYALDAGVSPDELKEVVYLITVPAGFPRAIEASQALQEVLAERADAAVGGAR